MRHNFKEKDLVIVNELKRTKTRFSLDVDDINDSLMWRHRGSFLKVYEIYSDRFRLKEPAFGRYFTYDYRDVQLPVLQGVPCCLTKYDAEHLLI